MSDLIETRAVDAAALAEAKEQVAAHQAECSCHPVSPLCCELPAFVVGRLGDEEALAVRLQAQDASGYLWHLDPLCKRRPEAKA